jgi:hypothetical protein
MRERHSPKNEKGIDTMAIKTTKKDNFNALLSIPAVAENADLVAFIKHELELLAKKSENRSTKPTAVQVENADIAERVPTLLKAGKLYRLSEIKAMIPALAEGEGTQRTARLCNDLVSEGLLVKSVDKKVVYFALAE